MLARVDGQNPPITSKQPRARGPGRRWKAGQSGNPRGRWRKGESGNPAGRWQSGESGNERGRPPCPVVAALALMRHAPMAGAEALLALIHDPRGHVAAKACIAVLDLAFGPPGEVGWSDEEV